jgi:hypothetical protein
MLKVAIPMKKAKEPKSLGLENMIQTVSYSVVGSTFAKLVDGADGVS